MYKKSICEFGAECRAGEWCLSEHSWAQWLRNVTEKKNPTVRDWHETMMAKNFDPCPVKYSHNYFSCQFYHDESDRRRTDVTIDVSRSKHKLGSSDCDGPKCTAPHNSVELFCAEDYFQISMCSKSDAECGRLPFLCCFAHNSIELRTVLRGGKSGEDFEVVTCPEYDTALAIDLHPVVPPPRYRKQSAAAPAPPHTTHTSGGAATAAAAIDAILQLVRVSDVVMW